MAKKKTSPLKPGDIVEIVEPGEQLAKGSKGEVLTTDPITIAVVHVIPIAANQIKKIFDASEFDWNDLRKRAKELELKAAGTRTELEAKIREHFKHEGRIEVEDAPAAEMGTAPAESLAKEVAADADEATRGAPAVVTEAADNATRGAPAKFKKGSFVKVLRDREKPEYIGAVGSVIVPGPPVDVKLLASLQTGARVVRRTYPESDLEAD